MVSTPVPIDHAWIHFASAWIRGGGQEHYDTARARKNVLAKLQGALKELCDSGMDDLSMKQAGRFAARVKSIAFLRSTLFFVAEVFNRCPG